MKEEYSKQNSPHGTNACPYRISGSDRQCMDGFGKERHAKRKTGKESRSLKIPFNPRKPFHLSKTESKACLKESCNDENNPIHTLSKILPYSPIHINMCQAPLSKGTPA